MLNAKERKVSSLNGKVGCLCATCVLFPNDYQTQSHMITKHTRGSGSGEKLMKET